MYVFWVRSKLEPNGLRQTDRLSGRFLVLHFAARNENCDVVLLHAGGRECTDLLLACYGINKQIYFLFLL